MLEKSLRVFGYDSIRSYQEEPIRRLLDNEDLLVVLPTGAGKSFIYSSVAIERDLKTLVFFPLISLMNDQYNKLKSLGIKVGVVSSQVDAETKLKTLADWVVGRIQFLFVAPERLENNEFMNIMRQYPPDFVVVDEIHVASDSAESFRPSYKKIASMIEELDPKLFLGLTATMTKTIESDIKELFRCDDIATVRKFYNRENLKFRTIDCPKPNYVKLKDHSYETDMRAIDIVKNSGVPSIVYCSTVKKVNELNDLAVLSNIPGGASKYTGKGLSVSIKNQSQLDFISNKIRVMFATNAFGMGVDKPNIGCVVMRTYPASLEDLMQMFGRGGRNGCECDCVFMNDETTMKTQLFFIENKYPLEGYIRDVYSAMDNFMSRDVDYFEAKKSICSNVGISFQTYNSILNIFYGYGILDRNAIDNMEYVSLVLKRPALDKQEHLYSDKILALQIEDRGCVKVNLQSLAFALGRDVKTVQRDLKELKRNGLVEVLNDTSFKGFDLKSDISKVDFEKLDFKRTDAYNNIRKVSEFVETPDSDKSKFLENYFQK